MSRRSATKKSLTELTDSGVSVVSASIDVPAASKDCRTQWRNQLEKKNELKHMRHGKKYGSRSGSLERANREEWGGRAQPFLGDPGMPLLPQPHIVCIINLNLHLFYVYTVSINYELFT